MAGKIPSFKCRVCGGNSYTGPFSTNLYECDTCSVVFGIPTLWSESQDSICLHDWGSVVGVRGTFCSKCGIQQPQT